MWLQVSLVLLCWLQDLCQDSGCPHLQMKWGLAKGHPQTLLRHKHEGVHAALTIYTLQKEENLVNEIS